MNRMFNLYFEKYPERLSEYEIAKDLYLEGYSLTKICENSIFERHILSNLLKADNVKIIKNGQKYSYNEKAFKKINNENDAYWLGFLYADGNINELRNRFDLTLSIKDKNHLEKFRDYIVPDKDILIRPARINIYPGKEYYCCRLVVSNKKIVDNLVKQKCLWSKTFDIEFPNFIPKKYMNHFIRGYFDGDGCITSGINKGKNIYRAGFTCANKDFLEDLINFLNINVGMSKHKIVLDKKSHAKDMFWCAKEDLIKFYNYLYKNATIYLDRKYNKYTEIIAVLS